MNHTSESVHITAHITVNIESALPSSPSSFLNVPPSHTPDFARGYKFWCIIIGFLVTNLLGALENTVVSTAAPVILSDLQMGQNFIWITNAFFVCSAAFQPLFGQLCNIFGRRWIVLIVAIFILRSGMCGVARNGTMLIAGRAVQGMGSGGIIMIIGTGPLFYINTDRGIDQYIASDIIVSDLAPLRQRGNYMAVVLVIYGIGVSLGPFIGGAIVYSTTWRWVFYLNLPVGGTSLKLQRIELVGNAILMTGTVAVLYALSITNPWSSWHKLVALDSPRRTGVTLLPYSLVGIPCAAISAMALSRWGKFRPLNFAGFALFAISLGLFSLQRENTSLSEWTIYQRIFALGAGMALNTLLPAFQAPACEADQAAATATWCFIRTFDYVWGVAIAAAIFNSRATALSERISDEGLREQLVNGNMYQLAAAQFIEKYPVGVQGEIRAVYREALKRVWQIARVFAGLACVLVLLEKEIPLRTSLETEYGLKESLKKPQERKDIERD
ncbi:hypothetical protein EAE99_002056 [Botrytis elliptica]|nr:hypothetical protein EAE99_002056 [Botrytis elliptica]